MGVRGPIRYNPATYVYYIAPLPQKKFKKVCSRYNLYEFISRGGGGYYNFMNFCCNKRYMPREGIERIPLHLRRGGEYGS